jgi:hypothetical protein
MVNCGVLTDTFSGANDLPLFEIYFSVDVEAALASRQVGEFRRCSGAAR